MDLRDASASKNYFRLCPVANIILIGELRLEMDEIVRVDQYSRSSRVALFVVKAGHDAAKIRE